MNLVVFTIASWNFSLLYTCKFMYEIYAMLVCVCVYIEILLNVLMCSLRKSCKSLKSNITTCNITCLQYFYLFFFWYFLIYFIRCLTTSFNFYCRLIPCIPLKNNFYETTCILLNKKFKNLKVNEQQICVS